MASNSARWGARDAGRAGNASRTRRLTCRREHTAAAAASNGRDGSATSFAIPTLNASWASRM
eukprot:1129799-Lingulodinium_polyedra.AAC.1